MFSFHDLKVIHLICMTLFLITTTLVFFKNKKLITIFHGLTGFLALISGFLIASRLAINLTNPPKWLVLKFVIWFLLIGIPPLVKKRLSGLTTIFLWITLFLGMIAIATAVYKPHFI